MHHPIVIFCQAFLIIAEQNLTHSIEIFILELSNNKENENENSEHFIFMFDIKNFPPFFEIIC